MYLSYFFANQCDHHCYKNKRRFLKIRVLVTKLTNFIINFNKIFLLTDVVYQILSSTENNRDLLILYIIRLVTFITHLLFVSKAGVKLRLQDGIRCHASNIIMNR